MSDATVGSELEISVAAARKGVENGEIVKFSDLVEKLAPAPEKLPVPVKLPLPAVITDAQSKALDHVKDVFGKVCPTERRVLNEDEIDAIMDERLTLDEIAKLAETRKESIRTTIFNHLDVEFEERGSAEGWPIEETLRDKDGHYVVKGEVPVAKAAKKFTREVRDGFPSVTEATLRQLKDAGDITPEQYLACTTQVRVFDENKFMLEVKKHPELLGALAKVLAPSSKTASFWARNLK